MPPHISAMMCDLCPQELSEASAVLATATRRSLVIIDELGRGTATHDGLAIALASLQALLDDNRCLTLFVTHYPQVQHRFSRAFHDRLWRGLLTGACKHTRLLVRTP